MKEINKLQREQTVLDDNTTSRVYFSRKTDVRATTSYWRILTVDTKEKHGCKHMRSAASITGLWKTGFCSFWRKKIIKVNRI